MAAINRKEGRTMEREAFISGESWRVTRTMQLRELRAES
jgi:hypothetical protein